MPVLLGKSQQQAFMLPRGHITASQGIIGPPPLELLALATELPELATELLELAALLLMAAPPAPLLLDALPVDVWLALLLSPPPPAPPPPSGW